MKHFVLTTLSALTTAALLAAPVYAACWNLHPHSGWILPRGGAVYSISSFDQDAWQTHIIRVEYQQGGLYSSRLFYTNIVDRTFTRGRWKISVLGLNSCGQPTGEQKYIGTITVP